MKDKTWLSQISRKQRIWLFATIIGISAIIISGFLINSSTKPKKLNKFNINMSIQDIAPGLNITGKGLARDLNLPINISKNKPLNSLGVTNKELQHGVHHIVSHHDNMFKYYIYVALVLWGFVFLVILGRPDNSNIKNRRYWYPRTPYIVSLIFSVVVAGFLLGKSPNPMEGVVKVFKSMVGLYPDPIIKVVAFILFIILAVIGNKIICGWACPFGASQELIYSLPILRKIKKKKLPFVFTNTIRACLFIGMLLLLFGIIGGRKGFVIYHYINPFNLFNFDFEIFSVLLTVIIALLISFITYRPFCQFICPFGLISWIIERFSIFRIRIDTEKCIQCGACIEACPLETTKGILEKRRFLPDCFSCARCLNVCPTDALKYTSIFKKIKNKRKKTDGSIR